jgi:predicted Fe-Mo cluster-binding NifX family protein
MDDLPLSPLPPLGENLLLRELAQDKELMMTIAVSAGGPDLEARVDPRFGRAPYFIMINPDTLEFEVVANQQNLQAAQGAGIQAAALVAHHRPQAVLTGNCGPKAFHTLAAAGIPVFLGASGSVREAVQQYHQGHLRPAPGPNVEGHW